MELFEEVWGADKDEISVKQTLDLGVTVRASFFTPHTLKMNHEHPSSNRLRSWF